SQTNTWRDDWDSRSAELAGRLPRAVQIGLVLLETHEEDGRDVTEQVPFVTTVDLAYADKISPDQLQQLPPDPNDPSSRGSGGVPTRGPKTAALPGRPPGLGGLGGFAGLGGGGLPGGFGGSSPSGGRR